MRGPKLCKASGTRKLRGDHRAYMATSGSIARSPGIREEAVGELGSRHQVGRCFSAKWETKCRNVHLSATRMAAIPRRVAPMTSDQAHLAGLADFFQMNAV